jgi:predicted nucleotidyltransferase
MANQSIIETAQKYVDQIPSEMNLKKAYLFGSYAKGSEQIDSDIDIALVIESSEDFFDIQRQLMRLRRKVDLRIEPHPIFEKDFTVQNPMAYEIYRSGIELRS